VCTGTVETGRDLRLRAEDARTGEERWSVTVPFRPTSADQCTNWYSMSWDGSGNMVDLDDMLDAEGFGARITGDMVQLYGCGIEAAVTSDGVLLGTEITPGTGDVESLRTGGYRGYTYDDAVGTVLYDADGGVLGEVDGYVLQPSAVDGMGPDTLLASGQPASRLRAYAPDGTLRWDVAADSEAYLFLAQVNGSAIILTGEGAVRGLDLGTGEERFTWSSAEAGEAYSSGLYVSRAFTDGQSVLLVVENGYGGVELLALDAVTGELAWKQDGDETTRDGRFPGPSSGLLALDGNLLEVTPGGVRGLG
jgi:outer membrane protein assembly factor BamB